MLGNGCLTLSKMVMRSHLSPFPPEAEFPNNATVRDNLEAAQQLVKDYLAQKVLRIVEQKPRCLTLWVWFLRKLMGKSNIA